MIAVVIAVVIGVGCRHAPTTLLVAQHDAADSVILGVGDIVAGPWRRDGIRRATRYGGDIF